jgi:phosphopantetheinyl transferase (holo-ACP synthase)
MELDMPVTQIYTSPLLGIWKIDETLDELIKLGSAYNKALISEVNDIKSESRKKEYLAVRLLLRHIMDEDVIVEYKPNGSPYLSNDKYNISISHTKGYAAIVLSTKTNQGIDIEYISPRAYKLRKHFLNKEELALVDDLTLKTEDYTEVYNVATLLWCAKESAFKALECENVNFSEHFHVLPFEVIGRKGIINLKECKTADNKEFSLNYEMTDDYILTWTR